MGCGVANTAVEISRRFGCHVTAIDIDPLMLGRATANVRAAGAANVTVANLVNRCFGGSKTPWSSMYPPGRNICGYYTNTFYISNFYNGTGPNDTSANSVPLNPYFTQPFVPAYGDVSSFNFPLPMEFYFKLQFKL